MSLQGIYFLGLTVLLVFYYIVVISMDLFKHSKKGKSHEEIIDVEDDEQKNVEETDEGFSVSTGGEHVTDDDGDQQDTGEVSDGIEEEEVSEDDDEEAIVVSEDDYTVGDGDFVGGSPEDLDDTIADIQQQMEESLSDGNPQYQEVMDSVSFEVAMDQPRSFSSSSKILKTYESD